MVGRCSGETLCTLWQARKQGQEGPGPRFQYTLHKPTLNGLLLSSLRLLFLKVLLAIGNNSLATKASTLGPLGVFKIHTLVVSVTF